MKKVIFLVFLIGLLCLSGSLLFAQEETLSSVGALGASNVYVTYLAIGAIADEHANEVYDDETTIELMQVLANLLNSSSESLQELLNSGILDPDDFSYVTEMINILNLLVNEAQGYLKYIETGDVSHANLYNNYRNNAWAKIEVLLGISE